MPETNAYSNCGWLFPNNNSVSEGAGKVGIELPICKAIRSALLPASMLPISLASPSTFAPPKVKE